MVKAEDEPLLEVALGLIVFSFELPLLDLVLEYLEQVLLDDYPQEFGLALAEELPDEDIVVAFEVAQGQLDALLVDISELADRLIIAFGNQVELPSGQIFLTDEEIGKVGEVFEEGALHEGDLVVDAGQLSDLVDEVKQGLRDAHHLVVHYLEELAQEESGSLNEVYGVGLLLGALQVVGLAQQETFHLHIAVLAEKLQEAEHSTEGQFVGLFIAGLEFIEA